MDRSLSSVSRLSSGIAFLAQSVICDPWQADFVKLTKSWLECFLTVVVAALSRMAGPNSSAIGPTLFNFNILNHYILALAWKPGREDGERDELSRYGSKRHECGLCGINYLVQSRFQRECRDFVRDLYGNTATPEKKKKGKRRDEEQQSQSSPRLLTYNKRS